MQQGRRLVQHTNAANKDSTHTHTKKYHHQASTATRHITACFFQSVLSDVPNKLIIVRMGFVSRNFGPEGVMLQFAKLFSCFLLLFFSFFFFFIFSCFSVLTLNASLYLYLPGNLIRGLVIKALIVIIGCSISGQTRRTPGGDKSSP